MQVSSQLTSQTMSKYVMQCVLKNINRCKWEKEYSVHDLTVEPWATGVWIKQAGLVSYKSLAEILRQEAQMKAEQLPVEKVAGGFLVKSHQGSDSYLVSYHKKSGWKCECMRYRCWNNRMPKELPQLLDALKGKVFCHHIIAAYHKKLG